MKELAKILKAYHVQGDEYGTIRFAHNNVTARREGACELDTEFNAVSCKRIPGADKYAEKGEVPLHVLVEDFGWWTECGYCNHHVYSETEGRVWDGDTAYCDIQCQARRINLHRDYQLEAERKEQEEIAAVDSAVAEFPGITDVVARHNYKGEIEVYFNFPGAEHRASWVLGSSSVYPAAHEIEAFKTYLAYVRAGGAA
ncbi:hypothetical protein WKH08_09515 [Pantoea agglomerans]|uniref:hypothetical protein n=1 Tax=Enterobacter agglomerans TaxID=549 RepID=UPI003C7DF392